TAARPELEQRWWRRYGLLAGWARQQGHARPPAGLVIDGIRIGGWGTGQRHQLPRGRENARRDELAEGVPGWAWQVSENSWGSAFSRIQAFARGHGHARVPQQYQEADGFYLGAWVQRQREERAAGRLLPARAVQLASVPGWTWDTSHDAGFAAGI